MDELLSQLLDLAMRDEDPASLNALLMMAIAVLLLERRRLLRTVVAKERGIDALVERFGLSIRALATSLTELKYALTAFKQDAGAEVRRHPHPEHEPRRFRRDAESEIVQRFARDN